MASILNFRYLPVENCLNGNRLLVNAKLILNAIAWLNCLSKAIGLLSYYRGGNRLRIEDLNGNLWTQVLYAREGEALCENGNGNYLRPGKRFAFCKLNFSLK